MDSISGSKSLSDLEYRDDGDFREDTWDLTEQNHKWEKILKTGVFLLPVVGKVGAAVEVLNDAITSLACFQAE